MGPAMLALLMLMVYGTSEVLGAPGFCGGSPCPPFQVIRQEEGYEVRSYDQVQWVAASFQTNADIVSAEFSNKLDAAYWPIRLYARGENVEGVVDPSPVPLLTRVCENGVQECMGNQKLMLYVPSDPAPTPINPTLEIYTSDAAVFCVSGFQVPWDDRMMGFKENLKALRKAVADGGETVDDTYHYFAIYRGRDPNAAYFENWLKC